MNEINKMVPFLNYLQAIKVVEILSLKEVIHEFLFPLVG
jgi:hypothetical protein